MGAFRNFRVRLKPMNAFPAYFPLAGRTVVIVGSGEAAETKARLFDGSPAQILRLGEDDAAAYEPQTYAGAALAFIATSNEAADIRAAAAARAAHTPVNVVDRPKLCDFFTPAVVDRGDVVVAIGTGGTAPLLAALLRAEVEAHVPEGVGRVAAVLGRVRGELRAAFPELDQRRTFLREALAGPAAQAALQGDTDLAEALLRRALAEAGQKQRQ
jgi:precorrin-2 dehydrogenase/sirohydrochlorin ferrochelatase